IFVPWINWFLLLLIVAAVIGFRSSDNLGAAYGIAVTGTMVITTLLALVVARFQWHWSLPAVLATGACLLSVDLGFFSANLVKVAHGGWFPLALGLCVFVAMTTWRRGRELVVREIQQGGIPYRQCRGDPQLAAAQPQAQQGAARTQRAAHGGNAGHAAVRAGRAIGVDRAGRGLRPVAAALRLRRRSRCTAAAGAMPPRRPAVRHDGHHVLPLARDRGGRQAAAWHGVVARPPVRLH